MHRTENYGFLKYIRMAWFMSEFIGCDTHLQPGIAVNNSPISTVKFFVNISQDKLRYIFIILLFYYIIYYVSRQQNKPTFEYADSHTITLRTVRTRWPGNFPPTLECCTLVMYIYTIVYVHSNTINCQININHTWYLELLSNCLQIKL